MKYHRYERGPATSIQNLLSGCKCVCEYMPCDKRTDGTNPSVTDDSHGSSEIRRVWNTPPCQQSTLFTYLSAYKLVYNM